jgi:hypothetical protein
MDLSNSTQTLVDFMATGVDTVPASSAVAGASALAILLEEIALAYEAITGATDAEKNYIQQLKSTKILSMTQKALDLAKELKRLTADITSINATVHEPSDGSYPTDGNRSY